MHEYTDFGKEVKIAMISLNLTNRALAQELGYKESTLCDVLRGRNRSGRRMAEIRAMLSCIQKLRES